MMTKLQSYTVKEVLKAFVPAFMALLLIMLLGFCVQLLNDGLDVVRLGGLPQHIIVFAVPWVMPAAFLTSIAMAFGRMSADNEIIAIRVGGVSLFHIMAPVLLGGLILSLVAAYFHFGSVPRARRQIEREKHHALTQVLKDRMAMSVRKQFTVSPLTVQYEKYSNGKMQDLFIVETSNRGIPRTVITAAEGTIEEDENRPGYIDIALRRCSITQLVEGERGGRGTWEASSISLPVRVAPELDEETDEVKHMPVRRLVEHYRKLSEEVAGHEKTYANPDQKKDELGDELDRLKSQRGEIATAIRKKKEKSQRLEEQQRRGLQNELEQKREQLQGAEERVEEIKEEIRDYTGELKKAREDEEDDEDYEETTQLQKNLREARETLEEEREEVREAKRSIEETRRQINNLKDTVASLRNDIDALEKERRSLDEPIDDVQKQRDLLDVQEEFRELKIRIHRRLSLSFAVFFFALLGMPLGILTRKRSIMVAFGIGFGIMLLLFYPFMIFGQVAAEVGMFPVSVAMWSGNGATFLISILLLGKVLRQ
ncbi:MAG: LptF/LptG family permease [Candidatus Brocadiia bacterium]